MNIAKIAARLMDVISPYSVDTVVASHNRAINRLQKVSDNRRAAAQVSFDAAHELLVESKDHAAEAARADRMIDRYKAFVD